MTERDLTPSRTSMTKKPGAKVPLNMENAGKGNENGLKWADLDEEEEGLAKWEGREKRRRKGVFFFIGKKKKEGGNEDTKNFVPYSINRTIGTSGERVKEGGAGDD